MFSPQDFCKNFYGGIRHIIYEHEKAFFIFYARLEHYNNTLAKVAVRRLDNIEIMVADRVIIGIVITDVNRRTRIRKALKKVNKVHEVYTIAEFWLINFDSRVIKYLIVVQYKFDSCPI